MITKVDCQMKVFSNIVPVQGGIGMKILSLILYFARDCRCVLVLFLSVY